MKQSIRIVFSMVLFYLLWLYTLIYCVTIKKKIVPFRYKNINKAERSFFVTDIFIRDIFNTYGQRIRRSGKTSLLLLRNGTWDVTTINKNCSSIGKNGSSKLQKNREAKIFEQGFSNTVHNDVKKNTSNYSESELPRFHRYIENFKTRKIIHPSIRLNDLDKKFMKCKESYNKLFSPISETDLFNNFLYTGRQKKGITSPKYALPKYIERPNYHKTGVPIYVPYQSTNTHTITDTNTDTNTNTNAKINNYGYNNIKTDEEIEIIANNCQFARSLMDDVSYIIREGITTNDIDIYILNKCINCGYYPSPLFYNQYPKSSCISINEILCHGIPDNSVLFENDIVKVDISVFKDGFHADMCESFIVKKKGKQEIKKDKKFYDFIYLNDKLKTKYTKFIFKYHFDLTKNRVVRKGKKFVTRRYKYVAPNTKQYATGPYTNEENTLGDEHSLLENLWNDPYDAYMEHKNETTNEITNGYENGNENEYENEYNLQNTYKNEIRERRSRNKSRRRKNKIGSALWERENEMDTEYASHIEQFNRIYDEKVIYKQDQKSDTYEHLQNYIYNTGRNKEERKHFDFFDKKINTQDYKKAMYEKNLELIKAAYECTMEAISICKHGVPFNKIGTVIHECIRKKNKNYYVAPNLCGHNIGKNFHEEPFIMHTINDDDRKMCENLVFTIEPIISEAPSDYIMWPDNWTLSNQQYFYSAQFEHTIWIKKNGAEILTKKRKNSPKFEWEKI